MLLWPRLNLSARELLASTSLLACLHPGHARPRGQNRCVSSRLSPSAACAHHHHVAHTTHILTLTTTSTSTSHLPPPTAYRPLDPIVVSASCRVDVRHLSVLFVFVFPWSVALATPVTVVAAVAVAVVVTIEGASSFFPCFLTYGSLRHSSARALATCCLLPAACYPVA